MFSLPDWAFYPIAAAACAAMIAGALSLGESTYRTPEDIRTQGLTFEGDRLNGVTTGNGLTVEFLAEGETQFLRIQAERGPFDGIQSAGAFFALTPDELTALSGHRVRIVIRARQAGTQPAEGLRVNFFVPGIGQDSWQRETLSGDFTEIVFDSAPEQCDWQFGYIGLWPDWAFEANTVDVVSVDLTALEPLSC
ncbi:hypothetical protein [Maricaulis parjimensis]|uniref:hypothetical protein n=1 Tax=Maricaulis parjimensis TaxID=144023 RepID=UPI00193A8E0A|nr:hypothetical protein [Maricaulis parjimensis]